MPTTVLLDAWHLSGHSANRGIGTYLRNVVAELTSAPDLHIVALAVDGTSLVPGVDRRALHRHAPSRWAAREHDLRLPLDLARTARAMPVDVVWSPADNPPRRSPRPWVQVLHDLIPLVVPEPGLEHERARWRRMGARLRDAAAVIADSAHTADDAVRELGVDPTRLHVAPLGVSDRFRPPDRREPTDPPTILYVGEYGAHKGFAEAFAVIGGLAERGMPHRLAMVGYLAPWYEPIVTKLRTSASHPERIELLGFVDDVVAAYQRADALIVTSRYEGFGLPALEAMACGTPAVAFHNSATAENVAGGGTLVPDGDVPAMVAALERIIRDGSAWAEASAAGIEHATAYSWARCAAVHADVFRSVTGGA